MKLIIKKFHFITLCYIISPNMIHFNLFSSLVLFVGGGNLFGKPHGSKWFWQSPTSPWAVSSLPKVTECSEIVHGQTDVSEQESPTHRWIFREIQNLAHYILV